VKERFRLTDLDKLVTKKVGHGQAARASIGISCAERAAAIEKLKRLSDEKD
jgi:hypothetical protein